MSFLALETPALSACIVNYCLVSLVSCALCLVPNVLCLTPLILRLIAGSHLSRGATCQWHCFARCSAPLGPTRQLVSSALCCLRHCRGCLSRGYDARLHACHLLCRCLDKRTCTEFLHGGGGGLLSLCFATVREVVSMLDFRISQPHPNECCAIY